MEQISNRKRFLKKSLLFACQMGFLDVVQVLINSNDINIEVTDIYGFTPLYLACKWGCVSIVQLLLDNSNICINKPLSYFQYTPLLIACEQNRIRIVDLLLSVKNIRVEQADKYGRTPLAVAYHHHNTKIMEKLVDYRQKRESLHRMVVNRVFHNKGLGKGIARGIGDIIMKYTDI